MGNCFDLQKKPVSWVEDEEDDDWGSVERKSPMHYRKQKAGAKVFWAPGEEKGGAGSTEIKIRISKRQLEELLRQVDSERVPLRRALADLVSTGDPWEFRHDQERHWRPELQSIPEVPE